MHSKSSANHLNTMKKYYFYCLILASQFFLSTGCNNSENSPPQKLNIQKEYVDQHNGYSEAVLVKEPHKTTIYISGQIGEGDNLESQMRSAINNLKKVLAESGASFDDVVKMNTYIVDYGPEQLEVFRRVRKEVLGDTNMPASTLVGVNALALESWLIEIEAVAVLYNEN